MTKDTWVPHSENIKVEISSLKDFADHIKDELEKNFRPSFQEGIQPMLRVQAPFGAGGGDGDGVIKEGRFFAQEHAKSSAAIAEMLGDAMRGMAALATAAMSIQAEYLMGDAFAEASFNDAFDAFNGGDGQKTLEDYWNQPDKKDDPKTTDANTVPKELTDPENYDFGEEGDGDGDGTGSTKTDMYDAKDIGKPGEAGHYHIDGDDENMHDKKYAIPRPEH